MPCIEMDEMYTETVTPEKFVEIYEKERDNIRSARVVPGKLGDRHFGKIVVERKTPVYRKSIFDEER